MNVAKLPLYKCTIYFAFLIYTVNCSPILSLRFLFLTHSALPKYFVLISVQKNNIEMTKKKNVLPIKEKRI